MTRTLQIEIQSLEILQNCLNGSAEDRILLQFTALYPNATQASVVTSKVLNASKPYPSAAELAADFSKRIVFKLETQGDWELQVNVVAMDNLKNFEKWVLKGLQLGGSLALGKLTAGIGNVVVGKVVEKVGGAVLGELEDTSATRYDLGETSTFIAQGKVLDGTLLDLDFAPSANVTKKVVDGPHKPKAPKIAHDQVVLQAGQKNGSIKLKIREV